MNTSRTLTVSRFDPADSTPEPRHGTGGRCSPFSRGSQVCVALGLASWMSAAGLQAQAAPTDASLADQAKPAAASEFAGSWDLTVRDLSGKEMPPWLEIVFAGGSCQAHFVGRWGNSRPVPKIEINGVNVRFISPKAEEDSKSDLIFEGLLAGDTITGTAHGPNGLRGRERLSARPPCRSRRTSSGASQYRCSTAPILTAGPMTIPSVRKPDLVQ